MTAWWERVQLAPGPSTELLRQLDTPGLREKWEGAGFQFRAAPESQWGKVVTQGASRAALTRPTNPSGIHEFTSATPVCSLHVLVA